MRALLLLGFLIAASTHAQEPEPDTTDWHTYYPLQVGNEWQYHYDAFVMPDSYTAFRVVGDTLVDNTVYFQVQRCWRLASEPDRPCSNPPVLIRYDEEHAAVVERRVIGGEVQLRSWLVACRLDLPLNGGVKSECFDESQPWFFMSGQYGATLHVGGDSATGTEKVFGTGLTNAYQFLSGLGLVEVIHGEDLDEEYLVYARIDGTTYGTPAITVGTEPAVPAAFSALTVMPNPLREAARLGFALDRPEALTLTVFDVRGRRVRTEPLGERAAGRQSTGFARGGLPAGAYVLRLTGDGGFEAARGVIVLR